MSQFVDSFVANNAKGIMASDERTIGQIGPQHLPDREVRQADRPGTIQLTQAHPHISILRADRRSKIHSDGI